MLNDFYWGGVLLIGIQTFLGISAVITFFIILYILIPSDTDKYLFSHSSTVVYIKNYYYKIRKYLSLHIALKIILWIAFISLNITAFILVPYQSANIQAFFFLFGPVFDIVSIVLLH